jgi:exopolysaccharide biosynthesis WecB/TagA/CpsF family protein
MIETDIDMIETNIVNLHNISMQSAMIKIAHMGDTDKLDVVVTPNIDHLVRLLKEGSDSLLTEIYKTASLCLCDSRIVEKLLKLKKKQVKEVITGSSLTKNLFNSDLMTNRKILIVGGSSNVFEKLQSLYPKQDLHHINPPMGFIDSETEVEKVLHYTRTLSPHFIFLAVGSPRQEILAHKLKSQLTSGVAICIGASILFLVGEEQRAPLWVQNCHMEWMYRMLQNPKVLMKRYFDNFLQIQRVYAEL